MDASLWSIPEGMRPDVVRIEADGVAYCGGEVWTAELLPLRPDRWEPATFTPDQPMRWHYGQPVTVTYAGEIYTGVSTAVSGTSAQWSSTEWDPHDEPVAEWLIEPGSSDAVRPDTSQPYFLDLISRIDEMTQDQPRR